MYLLKEIFRWFIELRDDHGVNLAAAPIGTKALKEAQELVDNPCLEECADVIIAACGAAFTLGHSWMELFFEVQRKLRVNRGRTWLQLPDGTYQHG